jgi:hypothetical protein
MGGIFRKKMFLRMALLHFVDIPSKIVTLFYHLSVLATFYFLYCVLSLELTS